MAIFKRIPGHVEAGLYAEQCGFGSGAEGGVGFGFVDHSNDGVIALSACLAAKLARHRQRADDGDDGEVEECGIFFVCTL